MSPKSTTCRLALVLWPFQRGTGWQVARTLSSNMLQRSERQLPPKTLSPRWVKTRVGGKIAAAIDGPILHRYLRLESARPSGGPTTRVTAGAV